MRARVAGKLERDRELTGRIVTAVDRGAGQIIITNPAKRNAMTAAMWRELAVAVRTLDRRADVVAIVVRGSGAEAFCAGADISEFSSVRSDARSIAAYDRRIAAAERALLTTTKPTIAMLHGICAGGGAAIALSCDLRFAADDLRFSIPAARIGAIYPAGTIARLVAIVGPGAAFDLLASARVIAAAEALQLHFVDRLVAASALEALVTGYVEQLATYSAPSIRAAQLAVRSAEAPTDAAARRAVARHARAASRSHDYAEGISAFLEKRAARFPSRERG